MCGIAGVLLPRPRQQHEQLQAQVATMGAALAHRGPDDCGTWADATAGIALAHRRLSILDLSRHGHQPMVSYDGRYVLTYNGEVYNFATLRVELQQHGVTFRGHSDTEILLAAISRWGLEASLARANGMFALALWDRRERRLWLARDRVGKKPLYYGWAGTTLVFGSELKALWQHPGFDNDVDRNALALLLKLDYIPAPYCIHERAFKLMPGCVLALDAAAVTAGAAAHRPWEAQSRYWDARVEMQTALATPFTGDDHAAEERLNAVLHAAVGQRMVADVPVGVFLSGGTDSSLVTALMQAQSRQPVCSFTIGFEGSHHDEAPLARSVATHLGTNHTELYVSGADALAVVPQLPEIFDEPFADASQIPTLLLARLTRGAVTVALSGDGGDELFFGYRRYQRALRNWRWLAPVPHVLRHAFACGATGEDSRIGGLMALRRELGARGIGDVYRNRVTRWRDPVAAVRGARDLPTWYDAPNLLGGNGTPADTMMLADFLSYLPDDVLCKVDRATMAASLEARNPLLDWQVVEFIWSLPQTMKYRDGTSKYLLKQVLLRYLPASAVHHPKGGFGAPMRAWLQGDLRDWAGDLLSTSRLAANGYLDAVAIERIWRRFSQGERKWHTHLWNVLMFESWQNHWRQRRNQTSNPGHVANPSLNV